MTTPNSHPVTTKLERRIDHAYAQKCRFACRAASAWGEYYTAIDEHQPRPTVNKLYWKAEGLDILTRKAWGKWQDAKAELLAVYAVAADVQPDRLMWAIAQQRMMAGVR